jgi:hypothetical protein
VYAFTKQIKNGFYALLLKKDDGERFWEFPITLSGAIGDKIRA